MADANGWVTLQVEDGTDMRAYVSRPVGSGPHPAMIVFQEALGVNAQLRGVADRYAAEGYVAIAPELFHRTAPGFHRDALDMTELMPLIRSLTVEGMIADARAAHAWLVKQDGVDSARIAAMGFCMGGRAAFVANSELPLAAAISYYGGSIAPALLDRAAKLNGPHLFFWGAKDKGIPPEQRRAVIDACEAAGKHYVDVVFSEAGHGFFNEQIELYREAPARESWAMGLAFLRDTSGSGA